jgi:putative N-acetyltransferase (TIGR04045 family)
MATTGSISPFSAPETASAQVERDGAVSCRLVGDAAERELHLRIRHEVFVAEQRVFAPSDRDERDAAGNTYHALGLLGSVAAGAVRFYPWGEPGVWKGDRLAVLAAFRVHRLGPPLVRFAVATAAEAGGTQMLAYVQPQNVAMFRRLGWRPVGEPIDYVGRAHQEVVIDLC